MPRDVDVDLVLPQRVMYLQLSATAQVRLALNTLRALIWALGIVLVSGPALADVVGDFELDVILTPDPASDREAVKMSVDLESNLDVTVTLSGLSTRLDLGLGVPGFEFGVITLSGDVGALELESVLVFATPFERVGGKTLVIPTGAVPQLPLFVRKSLSTTLNIAGITVETLAVFEDINFPNPFSNFAGATYTPASQDFRFGAVIAVSGQTVSGLTLEAEVGLCAASSRTSRVKKRSFSGAVTCEEEDPLLQRFQYFDGASISVSGLELGELEAALDFFFDAETAELDIDLDVNVGEVLSASGGLTIVNVTTAEVGSASLSLSSDVVNVSLSLSDTFDLNRANVTFNVSFAAVSLSSRFNISKGAGVISASFGLRWSATDLSFSTSTNFGKGGAPTRLEYKSTSFSLSGEAGPWSGGLELDFDLAGLQEMALSSAFEF